MFPNSMVGRGQKGRANFLGVKWLFLALWVGSHQQYDLPHFFMSPLYSSPAVPTFSET